jgi:lantibiotic modifying enzyme
MMNRTPTGTTGLNEAHLKDALQKALFEIAAYDRYDKILNRNVSIFTGITGMSLLYYHLYLHTENKDYYEKSLSYFEQSFNLLNPQKVNFSFGATGVMWLLNYFKQHRAFDLDFEEYLAPFDEVVFNRLEEFSDDIDPIHGLLGFANYFLERDTPCAEKALHKILTFIDQCKTQEKGGIAWRNNTPDPETGSAYHINFGYAHGVLSVIYFLCRFIHKKINPTKSARLCRQALDYFLSHRDPAHITHFPSLIDETGRKHSYRIAYCYGDLGVACGLTNIGRLLNDRPLLQIARSTALNIAAFSLKMKENINDVGLCHGAGGNGYMFFQLYRHHKSEILKAAALNQYERLLALKKQESGIAGFMAMDYDAAQNISFLKADPGFLTGTAGIGLSIMSFLDRGKNSSWDKLLLLS